MYAVPENTLLETTVRDWRSADGNHDAVLPEHRGDFAVKISRY